MSAINITNARKELYSLVEDVNRYSEPALIVSKKGNAVLVSESDWNAIQETVYLNAIPGMAESIRSGMDTRLEDCVPEEDEYEFTTRHCTWYRRLCYHSRM